MTCVQEATVGERRLVLNFRKEIEKRAKEETGEVAKLATSMKRRVLHHVDVRRIRSQKATERRKNWFALGEKN